MITAYRLSSSRYPPNSGKGAAIRGGRWNLPGMEVIYLAASRPLAVLEILVHYAVLPRDFVFTPLRIPDRIEATIDEISLAQLPPNWNAPDPLSYTQELGAAWIRGRRSAVLKVPSAIIPEEPNYVLNVEHMDFKAIEFLPSRPFRFDPRLK